MAMIPHGTSSCPLKRYGFQWRKKSKEEDEEHLAFNTCKEIVEEEGEKENEVPELWPAPARSKMCALPAVRLRSVFSSFRRVKSPKRVIATLFGHRHGHIHLAFQEVPQSGPILLIELATPTGWLVREMASGPVRIALECEKKMSRVGLLDEPVWQAYCNGRKFGSATRRKCGPEDWKVLQAVEPISMGAGMLPRRGVEPEDELMYMRARFERVVESKDSEVFYMMNPDRSGDPQLSIFLIRV